MKPQYLQQSVKPLFPNVVWSKPESKLGAGKLLIVGGQAHEFIRVAECFSHAEQAGAGVIRVLMPESTRKATGMLPNIEYAAANQSGSFAKEAFSELVDAALWSDAVVLAGDLGKNSETSLMLNNFFGKYTGQLVIAGDALESLSLTTKEICSRERTVIIINFSQLQQIGIGLDIESPITSELTNSEFAMRLADITKEYPIHFIIHQGSAIWNASGGEIARTSGKQTAKSRTQLAAETAVWTMQQPGKDFEAITTAVFC